MRPSQRRPIFTSVPGRPDLKRFVGFEGDPGTKPTHAALHTGFAGVGSAAGRKGLGALGTSVDGRGIGYPKADGTPGTLYYPDYNETTVWGTGSENDTVVAPVDPSTPIPGITGPDEVDTGLSIPFGVSVVQWRNPTTFQSVPILASTPQNVPVLSLNMKRNAVVIQNNSTATAPDSAPTFYIGFNAQPQIGLALGVAPGVGILLDIICPRDSIYLAFGPEINTGGTVVIQGSIVQGTYAPI